MTTATKDQTGKLTGAEIAALSKKHTISEWAVQGAVDPLVIDGGTFTGRAGAGSFLKRNIRS